MLTPVFFIMKPVKTLACLAKKDRVWYPSMICKEIDCTYPHMMSILSTFEENGLIVSENQGRIRIIKLTALGEDIAHDFENILRRFEKVGEETKRKK
jgi:predicted transcriptional regulator